MSKIKYAINATALLFPATGIASYVANLARALDEIANAEFYFFNSFNWSRSSRGSPIPGIVGWKRIIKIFVPRYYSVARYYQQRKFNTGVRLYTPNLYHEPNYLPYHFDGPTVI